MAAAELDLIDTPRATTGIVDRVAAVRAATGDDFDIAVDFHGRLSVAMARRVLPLLEPYLPFFVEEPLVPEVSDRIGEITRGYQHSHRRPCRESRRGARAALPARAAQGRIIR